MNFNILFTAKESDELAMQALRAVGVEGFTIQPLKEGENAPVGSIALYSGHNEQWGSRHMRVAAHRLYPGRPDWAVTTPFLVAVRKNLHGKLENAAHGLATMYKKWFAGTAGTALPWETRNGKRTNYLDLMEEWFDLVSTALGEDQTRELVMGQLNLDKVLGRGGEVVYNRLDPSRVVINSADLPEDAGENSVYRDLLGFTQPVVSYGTSDLANLFELLEAIKLGWHLNLPVAFETYPGSHNWGYWSSGFLNPSLGVLGTRMEPDALGFKPGDRYNKELTTKKIRSVFPEIGLMNIVEDAVKWGDMPLWIFYQKAAKKVCEEILGLLGIQVRFELTTAEALGEKTLMWKSSANKVAAETEAALGHPIVAWHRPDSTPVMSNRNVPYDSTASLHQQGWWLGGALIYDLVFGLGNYGPLVVMVKDSTAGRVNLLAKKYFTEGSGLHVSPVGLFRLSAETQNEDWSIDPLVMLELMRRWGPEKSCIEFQKVWQAMEVPLQKAHIGRKTVAKVSKEGIEIVITDLK